MCTARFPASFVPHGVLTCYDDAVCPRESVHCRIAIFISKHQNARVSVRKARNMVDRNRVYRILGPCIRYQKKVTQPSVLLADVVHRNVVDAKSCGGFCRPSSLSTSRKSRGYDKSATRA